MACSVSVDQELGGILAAQHLIGLGHRRSASSRPDQNQQPPRPRERRADGDGSGRIALPDNLVWQGGGVVGFGDMEGAELGRIGVRELLSRDDPPTGIVAGNDMYALGAYAGARDLGSRVPEDISIVGFDDIDLAEMVHRP